VVEVGHGGHDGGDLSEAHVEGFDWDEQFRRGRGPDLVELLRDEPQRIDVGVEVEWCASSPSAETHKVVDGRAHAEASRSSVVLARPVTVTGVRGG
jgi:hypothetical protein